MRPWKKHHLIGIWLIIFLIGLSFILAAACSNNEKNGKENTPSNNKHLNDDGKVFYVLRSEGDIYPYGPQYNLFAIYPSYCKLTSPENNYWNAMKITPALGIDIYYYGDYELVGKHDFYSPQEYNYDLGFKAIYCPSDDENSYIWAVGGQVDVEMVDSEYKLTYDIDFEDGTNRQGQWTLKPCGVDDL